MIPFIIISIEDDDDRSFMIRLYTDYYGLMRKHTILIVKDGSTAEDMIHDACVQLIKNISTVRALKSCVLPAYIVSTIRRVSLNYVLRHGPAGKYKFFEAKDELTNEMADISVDVEDTVLLQLDIERLERAIATLPQNLQDILNFKYLLDMDDEQIAQSLGIHKNSVRQYLTRARRKALSAIQLEDRVI